MPHVRLAEKRARCSAPGPHEILGGAPERGSQSTLETKHVSALLRYATTSLLVVYLAFALFALAAAIADLGHGPMSGIFLVIAALPWTLPIGWLLDRSVQPPLWLPYALTLAGILANALLLYGLVRLTGRWPR